VRYKDFRKKQGEAKVGGQVDGVERGTRAARGGRGGEPEPERRKPEPDRLEKPEQEALALAVTQALEAQQFDVIRARVYPQRRVVVMIEGTDGPTTTVEDCARANRVVADALTAAGQDAGAFDMEVESPGSDRPLTRAKDFTRFTGKNVTVTLEKDRDGRKNFTGALVSRSEADGVVTVKVFDTTEPTTFPAAEIREVRLHSDIKVPPRERP